MTTFWAKKDKESTKILGVPDHAADVAAVMEQVLQSTVIRDRLSKLAGIKISEAHIQRLCVLAVLHDAGKFSQGFQDRIRSGSEGVDHLTAAISLLCSGSIPAERFFRAVDMPVLAKWFGSVDQACGMLWCAFSHHGRPLPIPSSPTPEAWSTESFLGLQKLSQSCRLWFPAAYSEESTLVPSPGFQHVFNGLLTFSDWLGSDTRFFPLGYIDRRMEFSRKQAARALREIGFIAGDPTDKSFHTIFAHEKLRELQRVMSEASIPKDGSIQVLEAETGSGKTEAAFIRFLGLLRAHKVDGMYFALPTRSSAVQLHGRILAWARRAFPKGNVPPVILGVPGYMRADDTEGVPLSSFRTLWSDDAAATRGWASERPKRYMAGAIVVGTVDQVLQSALCVKHSQMRASLLTRMLLVVDEVHASDIYMTRILQEVLQWHRHAGGHALLMSATLTSDVRSRLLFRSVPTKTPSYPLLSDDTGELTEFCPGEEKQVTVLPSTSVTWCLGEACRIATAGGRVLIVRNLVKDAVKTLKTLERVADSSVLFQCNGVSAPHHGRFSPEDRRLLDAAVESSFGKHAATGHGVILVATQTVEQSLDIDADLLVTDLAPMDVLLQRIGRLHRHRRSRVAGCETPRCLLVLPESGIHAMATDCRKSKTGLGTVYEHLGHLELTRRKLEHEVLLSIPAMNRELVESTLSVKALHELASDPLWASHVREMEGKFSSRENQARLGLVNRTVGYLDTDCLFPEDLEYAIRARLGAMDSTFTFRGGFSGPFGKTIRSLSVPEWMTGAPGEELEVAAWRTDSGITRFGAAGKNYTYDRMGVANDKSAD